MNTTIIERINAMTPQQLILFNEFQIFNDIEKYHYYTCIFKKVIPIIDQHHEQIKNIFYNMDSFLLPPQKEFVIDFFKNKIKLINNALVIDEDCNINQNIDSFIILLEAVEMYINATQKRNIRMAYYKIIHSFFSKLYNLEAIINSRVRRLADKKNLNNL